MKRGQMICILLAVALWIAAAAAAEAPPRVQDIVDQVIVKQALQTEAKDFTRQELQDILQEVRQRGLVLPESMERALQRVRAFPKVKLAMELAALQLGADQETWDVADQHWRGELMMKLGEYVINNQGLPAEGELSQAEIVKLAEGIVQKRSGQNPPLNDPQHYRRTLSLTNVKNNPYHTRRTWSVYYMAVGARDVSYYLELDPKGELISYHDNRTEMAQIDQLGQENQVELLVGEYLRRYGGPDLQIFALSQQQLQALKKDLAPFEKTVDLDQIGYRFLFTQSFGPATEGSISREQAIEAAVQAVHQRYQVPVDELREGPDSYLSTAPYVYSVLLKADGDYYYKVSFGMDYLAEVNARTGQVETMDRYGDYAFYFRRITLDSLLPEEDRVYSTRAPQQTAEQPLPDPFALPRPFLAPQVYWDALLQLDYHGQDIWPMWGTMMREYGSDNRFWPQAMQALEGYLYMQPAQPDESFIGIPLPGEITAEEAIEAARAALPDVTRKLYQDAFLNRLAAAPTYFYSSPEPGRNSWRIVFIDVSERYPQDFRTVNVDASTREIWGEGIEPAAPGGYRFPAAKVGADGRPLVYGHKDIPQYYWDLMDKRQDTLASVKALIEAEAEKHGVDEGNWSLEATALQDLWFFATPPEGGSLLLSGLPDKDDIQQEQARALAWEAFRKAAADVYNAEVMDRLTPVMIFAFNARTDGSRTYSVEYRDPAMPGYVTLGRVVLDATTGEILAVEVGRGNG